METLRCTDCYEENHPSRERCSRCGRLLAPTTYGTHHGTRQKDQQTHAGYGADRPFDIQHEDAPNVMSERNRGRKVDRKNTAW